MDVESVGDDLYRSWGLKSSTVMMLNELGIEVDHLRFLTYEYIASMFPRAEDFPEFVLFRDKVSVFKGELVSQHASMSIKTSFLLINLLFLRTQ